jgi:hypothetical protein
MSERTFYNVCKAYYMKTTTLTCICFLFLGTCYSQTLKIDNGISTHSLKGEKFDLFPGKVSSYSGLLGLEYFQKKLFYLSSQIGYLKLGGKETGTFDGVPANNTEAWNYVHLNTSIRLRHQDRKTEFYVGAGPYLNVLLGAGTLHRALYDGYTTQRVNWGCKTEAGINEEIIDKFRIGLNCTYLLPISSVVKSPYTYINARSLAFYISLGYRLK